MNLFSFEPLLYLICLNGDMSLPSRHVDSVSSELTQTGDLFFFVSLHRLRQTVRGKNEGEKACCFAYLFLTKKRAGSLECQCLAQQRLTDVRSQ